MKDSFGRPLEHNIVEAPLIGAAWGAWAAGGATLAGMLTAKGLIGAAAGALGGVLLQKAMTPKTPKSSGLQQAIQAPQQPQATPMPALPNTPSTTPVTPVGSNAPSSPTAQPSATPGNISQPNVDGTAPPTNDDIAKGEVEVKRRRGRLATILTRNERQDEAGEEVERLGG